MTGKTAAARSRDNTLAVEAKRRNAEARLSALIEDLEFMVETSEIWERAADRLGLKPATLEDKLIRAGRFDLVTALQRNADDRSGVRRGRISSGARRSA